eukprot:COSAG04_NODE_1510_length_6492_cov_11.980291_6_plen_179_part_00
MTNGGGAGSDLAAERLEAARGQPHARRDELQEVLTRPCHTHQPPSGTAQQAKAWKRQGAPPSIAMTSPTSHWYGSSVAAQPPSVRRNRGPRRHGRDGCCTPVYPSPGMMHSRTVASSLQAASARQHCLLIYEGMTSGCVPVDGLAADRLEHLRRREHQQLAHLPHPSTPISSGTGFGL